MTQRPYCELIRIIPNEARMKYTVYPRLKWFGLRYEADVVIRFRGEQFRVENLSRQQTGELIDLLNLLQNWGISS